MQAYKLSQLRPTEAEIDQFRADARASFAERCTIGDLEEAIGNDLHESMQVKLVDLVRLMHAGHAGIRDAFGIASIVSTAFSNHVNKYAEMEVSSYLDNYADRKADELRAQGQIVETWA